MWDANSASHEFGEFTNRQKLGHLTQKHSLQGFIKQNRKYQTAPEISNKHAWNQLKLKKM